MEPHAPVARLQPGQPEELGRRRQGLLLRLEVIDNGAPVRLPEDNKKGGHVAPLFVVPPLYEPRLRAGPVPNPTLVLSLVLS